MLNLIDDLIERGVGIRILADLVRIDSSRPEDPMAQLAVVMLALFEPPNGLPTPGPSPPRRAAGSGGRSASPRQARRGRTPAGVGHTIADIITQTGTARTSSYRHLQPRPADQHTAAPAPGQTAAGPGRLSPSTAREDTP